MTGPGDELAELLWHHGPALRRPPPPFQPFTCSAAGSSRSHELKRHATDATNTTTTTTKAAAFVAPVVHPLGMHDAGLGLGALPVPVQDGGGGDDDDDAVPWLHCPVVVDDGDADTAPLPPEFCAGMLSEYAGVGAAAGIPAPRAAANKLATPSAAGTNAGGGEGVMNFTFFSRPLQRPQQVPAAASNGNPVECTVMQAAATNRLRSTPLFSDQRMAWLQPPAPKAPRTTVAAPPPPPPPQAPLLPDNCRHGETVATVAQPRPQQPEAARPPPDAAAAAVTTSSVCSGNGDRSYGHLKRSSHLPTDCSVSPDEDLELDDEAGAGAMRRSAARGAKRSRTAEVHNQSERRRRDRINEKMRALQELIPNCNKIDKASMLEEAIEYLKTLQMQVQMMAMGTGLCMPPMLLPAAAAMHAHHHLQAALPHPMAMAMAHAHAQAQAQAHFPHHHLGMGLGFGVGAAAAAAAAAAFDMRVAGTHFPCPPMAMPPGPMFGVPGQQAMPPSPPPAAAAAAFAHVAGTCTAAAEEMEPAPARTRRQGAEHPPAPVMTVTQAEQTVEQQQQHPKQ